MTGEAEINLPSIHLKFVSDGEVAVVKFEERDVSTLGHEETDKERAGLEQWSI